MANTFILILTLDASRLNMVYPIRWFMFLASVQEHTKGCSLVISINARHKHLIHI